jgi:hypothetical protein
MSIIAIGSTSLEIIPERFASETAGLDASIPTDCGMSFTKSSSGLCPLRPGWLRNAAHYHVHKRFKAEEEITGSRPAGVSGRRTTIIKCRKDEREGIVIITLVATVQPLAGQLAARQIAGE